MQPTVSITEDWVDGFVAEAERLGVPEEKRASLLKIALSLPLFGAQHPDFLSGLAEATGEVEKEAKGPSPGRRQSSKFRGSGTQSRANQSAANTRRLASQREIVNARPTPIAVRRQPQPVRGLGAPTAVLNPPLQVPNARPLPSAGNQPPAQFLDRVGATPRATPAARTVPMAPVGRILPRKPKAPAAARSAPAAAAARSVPAAPRAAATAAKSVPAATAAAKTMSRGGRLLRGGIKGGLGLAGLAALYGLTRDNTPKFHSPYAGLYNDIDAARYDRLRSDSNERSMSRALGQPQ